MKTPRPWLRFLWLGMALAHCTIAPSDSGDSGDSVGDAGLGSDAQAQAGQDAGPDPSDPLYACAALGGPPLQSLEAALDRINGLPEPASLACFVASLPRPLRVVATSSRFSAQPAHGEESPRIFVLTDGLVLSVVPSGPGASLLELSEWVSDTHTLKGELEFPVTRPLAPNAAFERLDIGRRVTSCGFCHREERPHGDVEGGFASLAFRVQPALEVSVRQLRGLRKACGAPTPHDPAHCGLLRALFDYGPVEQAAFPADTPLFLQTGL